MSWFCSILQLSLKEVCFNTSILELWGWDEFDYLSLSKSDILEVVNRPNLTGNLGPIEIEKYMDPIRDENGNIIGAKALTMSWFGQVNTSQITEDDISESEDGQPVSFQNTVT